MPSGDGIDGNDMPQFARLNVASSRGPSKDAAMLP